MIQGDVTNAVMGTEILYVCITNYELVGFANRVCQASGVWSGEEPLCEGKEGDKYYAGNHKIPCSIEIHLPWE